MLVGSDFEVNFLHIEVVECFLQACYIVHQLADDVWCNHTKLKSSWDRQGDSCTCGILAVSHHSDCDMSTLVALVSEIEASEVGLVLEQIHRYLVPLGLIIMNVVHIIFNLCSILAWCLIYSDCIFHRRLELNVSSLGIYTHIDALQWRTYQQLIVDCLTYTHVSRYWQQHWYHHALAIQCYYGMYPCGSVRMVGEGEDYMLLVLNEWGDIHLIPLCLTCCEVCTLQPVEVNSIQTWVTRDFWCWRGWWGWRSNTTILNYQSQGSYCITVSTCAYN